MSKRLAITLDETELAEVRKAARREQMTTSEWVRRALRLARRKTPAGDVDERLEVVRAAARHRFPTADIDVMLGEIERGYLGRTSG